MRRSCVGQRRDLGGQCFGDQRGGAALGQMHEQDEAGVALHQGGDRGALLRAHDQVAFPMAGHRPVLGLRRPFADQHDPRDPVCRPRRGRAAVAARDPSADAASAPGAARRGPARTTTGRSFRATPASPRSCGNSCRKPRSPAAATSAPASIRSTATPTPDQPPACAASVAAPAATPPAPPATRDNRAGHHCAPPRGSPSTPTGQAAPRSAATTRPPAPHAHLPLLSSTTTRSPRPPS